MKHQDPFAVYDTKFKKHGSEPSLSWEESVNGSSDEPEDFYEGYNSNQNPAVFLLVLALIFGIFAFRLSWLQIFHGQSYKLAAEGNHVREQPVLAPRGIIYDKEGQILVDNVPSFELVVSPLDLPADYENEVRKLAGIISFDPDELLNKLKNLNEDKVQEVSVATDISKEQALLFESSSKEYPGFVVENNPIRRYSDPLIFSHLVGYTGKINDKEYADMQKEGYSSNDYIGKIGLEISYEKFLRGISGQKRVEVDAKGVVQGSLGEIAPQAGDSLMLNIDGELQRELYKQIVAKNGNKKAAAIALNPQTGQVLALVSIPGFDNNLFAKGISQTDYQKLLNDPQQPLFNRAIGGTYPPGSTIKPVMASAALQEGVVTPDTKIWDNGDLVLGNFHFRGWKPGGLGLMDVRSAIAWSSDIYFYTVGGGQKNLGIDGLGPDRIAKYERLFGMGQALGIDLQGERSGLVPDPAWKQTAFKDPAMKTWYPGDTYHISIGQGDVLATPLQVAEWTAVIANGGTVYKPYIVDKVVDGNGNVIQQNKPEIIRAGFIDPKNIEIVREGMRGTVTTGTARSLSSLPISVAGKTGTAQFDDSNPNAAHAWFTAFAPYENPKIVITVMVEAGGEGSSASSPVVREVLKWWAENRYNK